MVSGSSDFLLFLTCFTWMDETLTYHPKMNHYEVEVSKLEFAMITLIVKLLIIIEISLSHFIQRFNNK